MKKTWCYTTRPITVDGNIAYVPLTRGKTAIIDAADAPAVGAWNWCAMPAEGGKWYAYCGGLKKIRLQQFLMPSPPGLVTDHRDRDGLNNRRSNLRFATFSQNSQNKPRPRIGSGLFKGVSPHGRGRWRARIVVNGKRLSLGAFGCPESAAKAYDIAAKKYYGEFAVLNFPDDYDAQDDMRKSIELGFKVIRERVAAGGEPWIPKSTDD